MVKINISSVIDHTLLSQTATYKDFERICQEAADNNFYSVCVPPFIVESCKKALIDTDVKICTVVGFPFGYNNYVTKMLEAKKALMLGADEIDAVINLSALKSKDFKFVEKEIEQLRKTTNKKILKIIVETSCLTEDEKYKICKIILKTDVDFIKTSTGFSGAGAEISDIEFFKKILGNNVKIKASGGISAYKKAVEMINAGANRIGTSKSLDIINEKNNS